MGLIAVDGVLPLPTGAAEVLEALEVTAEVGTYHTTAHGAERVLQVRVNLDLQDITTVTKQSSWQPNTRIAVEPEANLLAEFGGLDLNEASLHGLHEASLVAKGDPSRANRVLVAIGVDSGVDHTPKQVVHYVGQDVWKGGKQWVRD